LSRHTSASVDSRQLICGADVMPHLALIDSSYQY
jgi:hypothetical protein